MSNERIYKMKFSKVYPMLVAKAENKGRTKEEVDMVKAWLKIANFGKTFSPNT